MLSSIPLTMAIPATGFFPLDVFPYFFWTSTLHHHIRYRLLMLYPPSRLPLQSADCFSWCRNILFYHGVSIFSTNYRFLLPVYFGVQFKINHYSDLQYESSLCFHSGFAESVHLIKSLVHFESLAMGPCHNLCRATYSFVNSLGYLGPYRTLLTHLDVTQF